LTLKSTNGILDDVKINMKSDLSLLLKSMEAAAAARNWSDRKWAAKAGVRPETLSRLRSRGDCVLSTVEALAHAVGLRLFVGPNPGAHASAPKSGAAELRRMPARYGREEEQKLLDLCAEPEADPGRWRSAGPSFFVGGLAVMLASARGYDRARYLELAELLHAGITTPEVFSAWLAQSPVRPSRFLPMLEKWRAKAA
jgi:DNA-binding phage protein